MIGASLMSRNEQDLRQYEAIRKKAIEAKGFAPKTGNAAAWVPFQAQKESGVSVASVMISLIPGEISQEQIESWPETQIQKLVEFLAEAQRKGLIAAGSRDISIHSAKKMRIGGKTAIHFIMDFTGINNRQYRAEKYFVYTPARTVILTLQWTTQPSDFGRSEREGILASLKIR
jgi:hypothetical protein